MSTIRSAFEGAGVFFLDDEGYGAGVRFQEVGAASDLPKPAGPATDAIEQMEADIAADRQKMKR